MLFLHNSNPSSFYTYEKKRTMHQSNQNDTLYARCKACGGSGVILCFSCEGRGVFTTVSYGFTTSSIPCASCRGSGIKRTCEVCKGTGISSLRG